MNKIKKWIISNKKNIFLYSSVFLIMLFLARANVLNVIHPFAFGFLFAMIYLDKNVVLLSLFYLISAILLTPTFTNFISAISTVSFAVLLSIICKIRKKKIPLYVVFIFAILSQAGFLYFNLNTTKQLIIGLISVSVGICFMYVLIVAFSAIFFRGFQSRFTLDENICFSLFLIAFFSGLFGIYISNINISYVLVIFMIAFVSKVFSQNATICFSAIAGLGFSFANGNVIYIAVFSVYGLICSCFSQNRRIFPAVLVLMSDLVFGLFLNAFVVYNYINMISVLVCLVLFLSVPSKLFDYLRGFGFKYDGNLVDEFLIMGKQEDFKNRLLSLSGLFRTMQVEYRNLSIGKVDKDEYCAMLTAEIESRVCGVCPNKNICVQNASIHSAINQLIGFGMDRGKVNILDANNLLTSACDCLSQLICEVNEALKLYFQYQEQVASSDNGKMLVSYQMGATGKIFSELALSFADNDILDKKSARLVLDQLTADKIVVNECEVISGELGVKKIVLAVRNSDVVNPTIIEDLKNIFKINFMLVKQTFSRLSGWSILLYQPADKYKVAIGFAQKAVDAVSGDVYSFKKIGHSKYLFAIADGKGHGAKANEISSSALSIIESFYKSNFSTETIIHSVNKLLLPAGEENFTTLDACILDLSSGVSDFVKIGATISVVKGRQESMIVNTNSLPLGVMEKIYPFIEKKVLKVGDIVVMASDGVVDAFSSPESFADYVNNERLINVQMLADSILEEAESRSSHPDDMTVIVFKLNQNFA